MQPPEVVPSMPPNIATRRSLVELSSLVTVAVTAAASSCARDDGAVSFVWVRVDVAVDAKFSFDVFLFLFLFLFFPGTCRNTRLEGANALLLRYLMSAVRIFLRLL